MESFAVNGLEFMLERAEFAVLTAVGVFVRISAVLFLLPGFGERMIPVRVKLGVALAFSLVVWPLIAGPLPDVKPTLSSMGLTYVAEAACGIAIGLGVRFLVFALQTAGAIAAQSLSLSQMFGAGVAPEPEPTISTILTMAAIAVAMTLGLHVKAAGMIVESYSVLPYSVFPIAGDLAQWSTARSTQALIFAVSLSLPFVLASFVYNVAIGAINRAMPQLMVTFVGMPAITGLGLALLTTISASAVTIWHNKLDAALLAPLALNP